MKRFVQFACLSLAMLLTGCMAPGSGGSQARLLHDGERLVFLGDSITQAGTYVEYVDVFLTTRFPDQQFTLINLGLSSETAAGTSEPDHPFPRPNIHDRLERGLAATNPDVVTVCYGMNDGIYHPLSQERFDAYRNGITKLVERIEATGARVVLITPPPYDNLPVMEKTVGADSEKFGYSHPYRGYEQVLRRYADWIITQENEVAATVDLHTPMVDLTQARRKQDPKFTLAKDGVHPGAFGHWMMAQPLLLAMNVPATVEAFELDASGMPGEVRLAVRSKLPMPLDPRWDAESVAASGMIEKLNRYTFTVRNAPAQKYQFKEGDRVLAEVTREQLAEGLNLLDYPALSTNQQAAKVLKLIQQQRGKLHPAWRNAWIKKPTPEAEAALKKAEAEAAELESQIRQLAQPIALDLRLVPVK